MNKLLLLNTFYKEFGGENSNFYEEKLFLDKFFDLSVLTFNNAGKLNIFDMLGFFTNTNFFSNLKLKKTLKEINPDIVYVHNLWFKLNLGALKILAKKDITVLLKLHNFRFKCAESYFSQKHTVRNSFCSACNFEGKGIFNKYYADSYLKSFLLIWHTKKFRKLIHRYDIKILCLTKYFSKLLIKEGFNSKNIFVLPNNIESNSTIEFSNNSNNYVYAGKVDKSKGVENLIKSWIKFNNKNYVLNIVGDGRDLENLKREYIAKNIIFHGYLPNKEVLNLIKNSRFVITATKMFEGQPKVLMEASKFGIPSIFPDFGGMREFFPENYSFSFEQFNYESLVDLLVKSTDNKIAEDVSKKVFNNFIENFNEERIYKTLSEIIYSKGK